MAKAIIFDIDGTLTEEHSWTALTRDLGASVDQHLSIYEAMKVGSIDLATAESQLCDLWRATGNASKTSIMEFFTSWPLRHDAQRVVAVLQEKGYLICLITGFADMYAEYVADQLNISDYYANTQMSFDERDELISFSYKPNQAEVKLKQLQDFCSRQTITLLDCIAVGNGENDVLLFEATNRGVLISPDKAPENVKSAAWRQIDQLSDVLNLI